MGQSQIGTKVGRRELMRSLSNNVHRMRSNPDVQLLEASLKILFESDEEQTICDRILDIDEDSDQFVSVGFALILPLALDSLRLDGHSAKLVPQINDGVRQEAIRNRLTVIDP